ncbi:MAG: hypothetical protein ACRC31_04600, partial [Cetobacterium sp.]
RALIYDCFALIILELSAATLQLSAGMRMCESFPKDFGLIKFASDREPDVCRAEHHFLVKHVLVSVTGSLFHRENWISLLTEEVLREVRLCRHKWCHLVTAGVSVQPPGTATTD